MIIKGHNLRNEKCFFICSNCWLKDLISEVKDWNSIYVTMETLNMVSEVLHNVMYIVHVFVILHISCLYFDFVSYKLKKFLFPQNEYKNNYNSQCQIRWLSIERFYRRIYTEILWPCHENHAVTTKLYSMYGTKPIIFYNYYDKLYFIFLSSL